MENPLNNPEGEFQRGLELLDLSLTIIFVLEFLLKIMAFGFAFNGEKSYLRNYWNLTDFIIVIFSVRIIEYNF